MHIINYVSNVLDFLTFVSSNWGSKGVFYEVKNLSAKDLGRIEAPETRKTGYVMGKICAASL